MTVSPKTKAVSKIGGFLTALIGAILIALHVSPKPTPAPPVQPPPVVVDTTHHDTVVAPPVVHDSTPEHHEPPPVITPPPVHTDPPPVVTPPKDTAPTPPPVVTPPPNTGGTELSGQQFVGDDFTSYHSTADLMKAISVNVGGTGDGNTALYHDGVNGKLASIDETVTYLGHHTMKYTQLVHGGGTPQLFPYFAPRTHLWYRWRVRFSPGWTNSGAAAAGDGYKMVSWGWSTADGSGRIELVGKSIQLYWIVQPGGGGAATACHGTPSAITTEWSDNSWTTFVLELDYTGTTGIARLWQGHNDDAPTYRGTTGGSIAALSPKPLLNRVSIGLNLNQDLAKEQYLWWGDWEVVDGAVHANPFNLTRPTNETMVCGQ